MSPVQVTFFNYLKGLYGESELVMSDTIQSFIHDALDYPHWQQNRQQFSSELQKLIAETCQVLDEVLPTDDVEWPEDIQIVELNHHQKWIDVVNSHLTFKYRAGEKFRIAFDKKNKRFR